MKVLIIDDSPTHRLVNRQWIEAACPGALVIEAGNSKDGIEMAITQSPSCILLDYVMLGGDGIQALHQMQHDIPGCPPIIFLTCALTEELKRNALALGAAACFDKAAVNGVQLMEAIATACAANERARAGV